MTHQPARFRLFFLQALILLLAAGCGGPEHGPAMTAVDDRAGLLAGEEIVRIERFQKKLIGELDIDLRVVTLARRSADLDRDAVALFDRLAVGRDTIGARGVLLVVDPAGQQVRMEIGYDLEGIFPDGFVAGIEHGQMKPFFAAGRIGPGIEATVELIVDKALTGLQVGEHDPASAEIELPHLSGGGGARTGVEIGTGLPKKPEVEDPADYDAQPSPAQALQKYKQVLSHRIKDPNLGLYTPATRKFFGEWLVTDAQQDHELRGILRVEHLAETVVEEAHAVIRFPVSERRAAPYLLKKGERGWMLDFAAMHRAIRFNHLNQWYFQDPENEYMFAFRDIEFDNQGVPKPPPQE